MNTGNWIAVFGIIVTIILSRLDARSDNGRTRISNDLTKKSIKEEQIYNDSLVKTNHEMLKQRRSEESVLAISQFNTKIWPSFIYWWNIMTSRNLNNHERKNFLHSLGLGLYKSWRVYITTNVADDSIIYKGIRNRIQKVQTFYDIINNEEG